MQLLLYTYVCWNMVFRRIFRNNKWESVWAVIDGCGRLDVKHLIILHRIQFYRHIFYMNDSILHNLFCALMSADCVYDNYTISVFTRERASNVHKQFRADLQWTYVDAQLLRCLYFILCLLCMYFILCLFRLIVLLYCTVFINFCFYKDAHIIYEISERLVFTPKCENLQTSMWINSVFLCQEVSWL